MKSLLVATVLASAVSAAHDAYLWTVDVGSTGHADSMQAASVDSFIAERILARRKGVKDLVKISDPDVLEDIQQYGGTQPALFGSQSSQPAAKIFISITGYEGTVSDFNTLPDLWVEEPESSLLDMFEAKSSTSNICEYAFKIPQKNSVSVKYTYQAGDASCLPHSEVQYSPEMIAIAGTVPTYDELSGRGISSFHRIMRHLAATDNVETTLLVLPPTSKLAKSNKSELKKRAEMPLKFPRIEDIDTSILASNSSSNFTLPRVIPQYFQSKDVCVNTTNSCMGHGACVKAHGNLFHCKCNSTVVRVNKDGTKKHVKWGGNACQKKDVSVEFILFASFGIFFTAVVAGSIGLLFNMGSQDLPSVIGAGVVGPRAQR